MNSKRYKFHHPIGVGSYSTVYYATHISSSLPVAIKAIQKSNKSLERRPIDEVSIFRKLSNHPFIPTYIESFEDDSYYYIVMEYIEGGNLLHLVNSNGVLGTKSMKILTNQLISVVSFIHSQKIIHRDIKIENILLDRNNNIRLTDFGLATMVDPTKGPEKTKPAGTYYYIAPEVIRGQSYDDKSDVWSAGVVLYTCAFGTFPFNSGNFESTLISILNDEIVFPNKIDSDLEDLIRKMLIKDQKMRISINEILNHPFLKDIEVINFDNRDEIQTNLFKSTNSVNSVNSLNTQYHIDNNWNINSNHDNFTHCNNFYTNNVTKTSSPSDFQITNHKNDILRYKSDTHSENDDCYRAVSDLIKECYASLEKKQFCGIESGVPVEVLETDERKAKVAKTQKMLASSARDPMAFLARRIAKKGHARK